MEEWEDSLEYRAVTREYEAVKHIAYGLYMCKGDDPLCVSLHECISFEDFHLKDHKVLSGWAWGMYTSSNEILDDINKKKREYEEFEKKLNNG